jgi:hypothetical protein
MRPKKGFRVDREFINDHLGRRIPGLGYIEEIIYLFRRRNPDYENKLENTDDCEGAYKKWLRLMELMDSACGYVTTREVMLVLGVE